MVHIKDSSSPSYDMDSGRILNTLKKVGPPGWYAWNGWSPSRELSWSCNSTQRQLGFDFCWPISGTFLPPTHIWTHNELLLPCRTSDASAAYWESTSLFCPQTAGDRLQYKKFDITNSASMEGPQRTGTPLKVPAGQIIWFAMSSCSCIEVARCQVPTLLAGGVLLFILLDVLSER